jgi:hypothetical protein
MTIALLTLIVMLGASFLIVAHADNQQSATIAEKGSAESIVMGYMASVNQQLTSDLYFLDLSGWDTEGVFSRTDQPIFGYIDAATAQNETISAGSNDNFDLFLASSELVDGKWPHITNFGKPDDTEGLFINVDPGEDPSRADAAAFYARPPLVDTDGDGVPDARLFDTGTVNMRGDRYWIAVRVFDTSGLINVNTAGNREVAMPVRSPGQVDIRRFLDGYADNVTPLYDAIHVERCGDTTDSDTDLLAYYESCARRPLSPVVPSSGSYRPFAISDEFWLRWLREDDELPSTAAGRLHEHLSADINRNHRRLMTTWNSARALPRDSAADFRVKKVIDQATALDEKAVREALTRHLSQALDGTDGSEKATSLVANLWASISDADPNTQAFGHKPASGGSFVYGLVEQLVITEAYAYQVVAEQEDDDGYCYAIELANLSDVPIDASRYNLVGNSTGWNFAGKIGVLDPGDRVVLFYFSGRLPDNTPVTAATFGFDTITSPKFNVGAALDLSEGKTVKIERTARRDGTTYVTLPVDRVTGSDFGFATPGRPAAGAEPALSVANGRRDDVPERGRYLVGGAVGMVDIPLDDASRSDHRLGATNNLDADAALLAQLNDVYEGFTLKRIQGRPGSMADLGDLYTIALRTGGSAIDLPTQLADLHNDPSRGKLDWSRTAVCTGSKYPDVPWAAIMGELVELLKPDETRPGQEGPDRIYGKININTAPEYVLRYLPWPQAIGSVALRNKPPEWDGSQWVYDETVDEIGAIAEIVAAYRDKRNVEVTLDALGGTVEFNYSNRDDPLFPSAANDPFEIPGLRQRTNTDHAGYLTPGEVAIPLGHFAERMLIVQAGGVTAAQRKADYLAQRNSLYHAVGSVIDVRSDTFAATVRVQLRKADDPGAGTLGDWSFITAVDRSNIYNERHRPVLLMFAEVK